MIGGIGIHLQEDISWDDRSPRRGIKYFAIFRKEFNSPLNILTYPISGHQLETYTLE